MIQDSAISKLAHVCRRTQAARKAWGQFLVQFSWNWFGTVTFRNRMSREKAWQICHSFLCGIQNASNTPLGWFAVEGRGSLNGRLHLHFLLAGIPTLQPRECERSWFRLAGGPQPLSSMTTTEVRLTTVLGICTNQVSSTTSAITFPGSGSRRNQLASSVLRTLKINASKTLTSLLQASNRRPDLAMAAAQFSVEVKQEFNPSARVDGFAHKEKIWATRLRPPRL